MGREGGEREGKKQSLVRLLDQVVTCSGDRSFLFFLYRSAGERDRIPSYYRASVVLASAGTSRPMWRTQIKKTDFLKAGLVFES